MIVATKKEEAMHESDEKIASRTTLGRRTLLLSGAALTVSALARSQDYSPQAPPTRYPEPNVVVIEKAFAKYKIGNTPIKRLHTGLLWAEGPAWCGAGNYLVWSDIPNNVQNRWLQEDG